MMGEDLIKSCLHLLTEETIQISLELVTLSGSLGSWAHCLLVFLYCKTNDCLLEAFFQLFEFGVLAVKVS